jgi:predicted TIM-barrel fold metal-dependent hydrolase
MRVIDSRVRLRTEELMKAWTTNLNPVFKDYIGWYKMKDRITVIPTEDLIAIGKDSGVEEMVVCGGNHNDNVHIKDQSQKHNEIIPVGGISIKEGVKSCLEEIKWLKDNNFAAVNFGPFMSKMSVNDRLLYPVYAYCEFIKIPVIVHASLHYWREAYMWHGQPQYVDEVAVDFPELKFIMSHGGNGFGPAVLAVAQRHPNVYLEFSALRPNYMAPEFIHAANTYLKKKCIFGTDYPLIEFGEQIDLWKESLRKEVWDMFFYQNILDALYNDPVPR